MQLSTLYQKLYLTFAKGVATLDTRVLGSRKRETEVFSYDVIYTMLSI